MIRFGNLRFEGVVQSCDCDQKAKRLVNIGDSAELLAIDLLYQEMGISPVEIGSGQYETGEYDGEYVILPVNLPVTPDCGAYDLLRFPPKIIPVYLGLCLMNLNVSREQLDYLRKYEPIGCRDERTMNFLRAHGVTAYVSGCVVGTYKKTDVPLSQRNTVFFVDVPSGVLPFIPGHLRNKIEFLDHEFYETAETWGKDSGKARAAEIIERYRREARLIVTSRFHAAVLGLALGIPTIVVLENNFFKWSWVSKYLPVYTPDCFSQIDWDCGSVDFEPVKERMRSVAKRRILETRERYDEIYSLSMMHENPERSDAQNLLYHSDARREIGRLWSQTPGEDYVIWGATENADIICGFLEREYPKARLVRVYDLMRGTPFHGRQPVIPTEEVCLEDKDVFTIVTSNSAKNAAEELFQKIGKRRDRYVLCRRSFLSREDMEREYMTDRGSD